MIRRPQLLLLAALAVCAAAQVSVATADATSSASQPATPTIATTASEDEAPESVSPVSVSYDATVASKYLFQGIDYSDGTAVFQPNLAIAFGDFTAGVWANHQLDLGEFNEFDLSVKYTRAVQKLAISPGYMYLAYPNRDWDPSQELFVDFALEAPFNPTLSIHYDVDAGTGTYSTLGLSHEVKAPFSLAFNLFHHGGYYGMTGIPSMEIKASAAIPVGTMTVTPALSRFATWENGHYRDEATLPSTWLFAVNLAH